MSVVDDSFDNPLRTEEKATMPLAGGIANMGYQCGMLWGAALAAGAQSYRLYGPGPQAEAEAIAATQKLVKTFCARTNNINCLEITELDMQKGSGILKFFLKGGPIGCFRMAAGYAREAYGEIYSAFSEEQVTAPSAPVSCASMLAEKMGVSEMHAVMAAGLAGGIGLSGGACGVFGAAIWISGMNRPAEPDGFSFSDTWVGDMTERFLESSDYEFECSEIVGRRFENIGEHAAYINNRGCAEIIEALAISQDGMNQQHLNG
ncbi:C-GCAxxG-C-C family (seleno)protein [Chloroflexota bacterium]